MEKYSNIYYKAGDHPHPIVRISYMVDNFIKNAKLNFPEDVNLDSKVIVTRAFQIAEYWFSQDNTKTSVVKEFAKFFTTEGQNIADYINNALILESRKRAELVMNRPQKKG